MVFSCFAVYLRIIIHGLFHILLKGAIHDSKYGTTRVWLSPQIHSKTAENDLLFSNCYLLKITHLISTQCYQPKRATYLICTPTGITISQSVSSTVRVIGKCNLEIFDVLVIIPPREALSLSLSLSLSSSTRQSPTYILLRC